MTSRFYVTTPIYYVNDVPHIGTAYTTIVADALARFHRLRGERVRFLTGTDEHGLKLDREAQKRGQTPQAFVDEMSVAFREAWPVVHCQPDDFIRTTEPRHVAGVQALWRRCADAGDIYLGHHEGLYCVACEAYYTEKDLLEGNVCPQHKKPVEWLKEPSYFFRLSKYGARLLALYERRPEMVQPESRRNEVLSFLRSGLNDLSVSRTSFTWGVPVPGDPTHVMYVWFDALANYLTALGDGALKGEFWPPDVHLVGKDILRFHSVYWPAFLLSAGYSEDELPRTVFAHGFLTINGQRFSKSLGNAISPVRLAEAFGPDELRYYLLREVAFGQDGDFSIRSLIGRTRAELAGALGNLLHRTLKAFVVKYFDAKVPRPEAEHETDRERALRAEARAAVEAAARAWTAYEPHRALEATFALVAAGNKYFDESAPWQIAKDEAKRGRLATVLYHVLETLRIASLLLWPALPIKMDALRGQLGLDPVSPAEGTDLWPFEWGGLAPHAAVAPGDPLFKAYTRDEETALVNEFAPPAQSTTKTEKPMTENAPDAPTPNAAPAPEAAVGVITYDDFAKVELKLGLVTHAERIPRKDKLLKLTVDAGEAAPRTIIAGIALSYAPEQLVGRRLVIVANLAPRDFGKGLVSHGMLLAAGPSEALSIVTVEKDIAPGTRVK